MPPKLTDEPRHIAAHRASLRAAWEKRRSWSRTDTSRFLSDRSESLLALLRRRPGTWPKHTAQLGYWLRDHEPALFNRAHATLAGAPDDPTRDRLVPSQLV
jgi:hypothetical protein